MNADEKLVEIPALKEQGNKLYMEKKVDEATEKYRVAIGMLEQLMLR
jgi:AH receptor-interacting protein